MINDDDMDFELEPDEEWDSMDYISDMRDSSRQMMMNVVYSSILNNKIEVVNSMAVAGKKLEAIEHVLSFFEELEDYEKCAELKKIIDKIKE